MMDLAAFRDGMDKLVLPDKIVGVATIWGELEELMTSMLTRTDRQ